MLKLLYALLSMFNLKKSTQPASSKAIRRFPRAAADGKVQAVGWLIRANSFDINVADCKGRTALHRAAWRGHENVVKLLLESGADPNIQDCLGNTAAFRAAFQGQTGSLRCLLDCLRTRINLQNRIGRSPLHAAAENGHENCVSILIRSGASLDLTDSQGCSPVHSAAEKGQPKVLDCLIRSAARIDLATPSGQVTPLHIAAGHGHAEAVGLLLNAGADASALDCRGWSALHLAALMGRAEVIPVLLAAGCSTHRPDNNGFLPVQLACFFGHVRAALLLLLHTKELPCSKNQTSLVQEVLSLLEKCPSRCRFDSISSTRSTDLDSQLTGLHVEFTETKLEELSENLHKALINAGFSQKSAAVQISLANSLQRILQRRWNQFLYIVGSFADGWGNSLRSMSGITDLDADIDVAEIHDRQMLHLRGHCNCGQDTAGERELLNYGNGHVECDGVPANPTQQWGGSASRPSTDSIPAYRCCCYPSTLKLPEIGKSNIRPAVITAMTIELFHLPPHLVAASEPSREGQQLRFSTSFLERRIMRSLTTEQGHVFVLIKHLVKQVLTKRSVKGLKTYHAKTLMFYLLDESPAEEWQPKNLMKLVRRALDLLLEDLRLDSEPDCCMQHFFLADAKLYLKKNHDSKRDIASAVEAMIKDLPQLLQHFMEKLQKYAHNGGQFIFDPFLILPNPNPSCDGLSNSIGPIDTPDIYNAVRSIWLRLAQKDFSAEDYEALVRDIKRLPNCAATARCCLLALTNLRHGREDEANVVLSSFRPAVDGFMSHADLQSEDDVSKLVQKKLELCDWAKKFCFVFSDRPELGFLAESIRPHFPSCILYVNVFYLNFEALYRGLCLQLGVATESQRNEWFKDILEQDQAQLQEILVMMQFCDDSDRVASLIQKQRKAICEHKECCDKALDLMMTNKELLEICVTKSLEEALKRLKSSSNDD